MFRNYCTVQYSEYRVTSGTINTYLSTSKSSIYKSTCLFPSHQTTVTSPPSFHTSVKLYWVLLTHGGMQPGIIVSNLYDKNSYDDANTSAFTI